MTNICSPGTFTDIGAVYTHGRLIIWARGMKPTPCHSVRIRRASIEIFPPQYVLEFCTAPGGICADVLTPYEVAEPFIMSYQATITINFAGGHREVAVTKLGAESAFALPNAPSTKGVAEVRLPLVLKRALDANAPATPAGAPAERREATGFSNALEFTEAFNDAVAHLPKDPSPFPDKLITVTVEEIGAMFGGIGGVRKLFVRVSSVF